MTAHLEQGAQADDLGGKRRVTDVCQHVALALERQQSKKPLPRSCSYVHHGGVHAIQRGHGTRLRTVARRVCICSGTHLVGKRRCHRRCGSPQTLRSSRPAVGNSSCTQHHSAGVDITWDILYAFGNHTFKKYGVGVWQPLDLPSNRFGEDFATISGEHPESHKHAAVADKRVLAGAAP